MAIPGDFGSEHHKSLADRLGIIPQITAIALPSWVSWALAAPQAVLSAIPKIPDISISLGSVINPALKAAEAQIASELDKLETEAIAAIPPINPITGE